MLNLVYDSIFLLREMCIHCVSSVMVSLIGFVSDKCSFIVAFVVGLFIWIYIFTVRCTFRMSTRRLYVILFVLLFTVTILSFLLLRDVLLGLQVAEELLVSFRQTACIYNYDFS